jgi:hypothetical protein
MTRRKLKVSKAMLFTWLMLAGFIILLTPERINSRFQLAFVSIFKPVLGLGRNISLLSNVSETGGLNKSTPGDVSYRNYCHNLEAELRSERRKVAELTKLKGANAWQRAVYFLADIITVRIDSSTSGITINRGRADGLRGGEFVLGNNSVIGIVSGVARGMSTVKLTTDPACKLAVQVYHENAYIPGIMQGISQSQARIKGFRSAVAPGDIVYTYKEPWFVETPIIVGKVVRCRRTT